MTDGDPYINKVHFRAYQADEDFTFNDGGGGGGGGVTNIVAETWIYFPSASMSLETLFNVDVLWVSDGTNESSPMQGIYPIWRPSGTSTWQLFNASATDLGVWVPDTWYHIQLTATNHLNGTVDSTLTVDGVDLYTENNIDITGSPGAMGPFIHFGIGNNADGQGTQPIYFDSPAISGSTIDTFEGGSLGAWDAVVDGASISTDFAHDGTHSLKADGTVFGDGYVLKNL